MIKRLYLFILCVCLSREKSYIFLACSLPMGFRSYWIVVIYLFVWFMGSQCMLIFVLGHEKAIQWVISGNVAIVRYARNDHHVLTHAAFVIRNLRVRRVRKNVRPRSITWRNGYGRSDRNLFIRRRVPEHLLYFWFRFVFLPARHSVRR